MSDNLTRAVFDNGLTVQLKEIHTAPIISQWVWYRVGSRSETPGLTGISHWVEHMQFKGTPQFPAGLLDKAISRDGGYWNAFTYMDWTTYFETLPAEKIDLGMRLEADRMTSSLMDEREVESERTVIISEREGSENEPLFRLGEAVQKASFDHHPYRVEVIGEKEDLHRIQRQDLYDHYRTHYTPANAVLTAAGDFETGAMLERLHRLYDAIPGGQVPQHAVSPEAPLSAGRKVELHGPGETTYLQIAYRAPAAADPDFFACTVVDSLLTGPTGLNMFGGGGLSNKTSRLYRLLVESEIAVGVSGGLQATLDPFLYDITITLRPGRTPAEALEVLDGEIERLQHAVVDPAEITRAIKQARALFAYGSENITNQAFWLGYAEMFAKYDWFVHYVDALSRVKPEDVQHMASTWLHPDRRVVGTYLAEDGKGGAE